MIKSVENPTALLTIIEIARDSNFELILYKNKSEVPASKMSIFQNELAQNGYDTYGITKAWV